MRRDGADGVNEAGIGVGFYWLFPHRTWLGIEPRYGWDFERNSEISQFQMHIGKAFANGLAVEASWGSQDRVDRGALRDDKLLVLSLSWQFGSPPD